MTEKDIEKVLKSFRDYCEFEADRTLRPETIKTYVPDVKNFLGLINKEPQKINNDDVLKWKKHCLENDYQKSSLPPLYGSVKKFLEYLVEKKIIDESVDTFARKKLKAQVKKGNTDDGSNLSKKVLSPEKFQKIFEIAKKRNYRDFALFKTMFWIMSRRCEIINIEFRDIDWEKRKFHYRDFAKGGKEAIVNISDEAIEIIQYYRDNIREEPKKEEDRDIIFLRDGHRFSETKVWELHQIYKKLCRFHLTSHMWRHTGITEYAKVEKDVKKVQHQARHSDVNTTMKYINYASGDFEKSYHEKFAKSQSKSESDEISALKKQVEELTRQLSQNVKKKPEAEKIGYMSEEEFNRWQESQK